MIVLGTLQPTSDGAAKAVTRPRSRLACPLIPPLVIIAGAAALDAVAKLPALETFSIGGANFTDEGIQKIAAVKTLGTVKLGKMKGGTADGVAKLRAARPDMVVEPQGLSRRWLNASPANSRSRLLAKSRASNAMHLRADLLAAEVCSRRSPSDRSLKPGHSNQIATFSAAPAEQRGSALFQLAADDTVAG